MRIQLDQLPATLSKRLAPVYFISGDEPLQLGEAADAVRLAAKKAGYDNRELFTVETGFSWNDFIQEANTGSIFSDRKIIDLRLSSGKPGKEGAETLKAYCSKVPDDTILLITAGKIAGSSKQAGWFHALDKAGVIVQVWPLQGNAMIQWLQRRLQSRGIKADRDALAQLISCVEGNLLAAAQEVEKLYILYGSKNLDRRQILDAVADSSRFDVFNLVDCVLSGQANQITRILRGLKHEGVAGPIVLWALTRETRLLIEVKCLIDQGHSRDSALRKKQIWDKRHRLVIAAINRLTNSALEQILLFSAKADRQMKGEQHGDAWQTLMSICLILSGVSPLHENLAVHGR